MNKNLDNIKSLIDSGSKKTEQELVEIKKSINAELLNLSKIEKDNVVNFIKNIQTILLNDMVLFMGNKPYRDMLKEIEIIIEDPDWDTKETLKKMREDKPELKSIIDQDWNLKNTKIVDVWDTDLGKKDLGRNDFEENDFEENDLEDINEDTENWNEKKKHPEPKLKENFMWFFEKEHIKVNKKSIKKLNENKIKIKELLASSIENIQESIKNNDSIEKIHKLTIKCIEEIEKLLKIDWLYGYYRNELGKLNWLVRKNTSMYKNMDQNRIQLWIDRWFYLWDLIYLLEELQEKKETWE